MRRFSSILYILIFLINLLPSYGASSKIKVPPSLYPSQNPKINNPTPIERGDVIYYQVLEDRDQPVLLVVDTTGEVFITYYGKIKVEGLTIGELVQKVKTLLETTDYKTATVLAQIQAPIKEKRQGRVYLSGRFNRIGAIQFDKQEDMTISKAILLGGGFTDFADSKKVKIVRKHPDRPDQTIVVDVESIIKGGKIDRDLPIQDGDLIIAPQKIFNW
jgi:polysaccharide export outer membrane protein